MAISPLAQKLAQSIHGMIASGDIPGGSHLSTPKLAERFDVSRSPVKEALALLADRGVLTLERNRGYFVNASASCTPIGDEQPATDEPPGYIEIADDWLRDQLPSEVTAQFMRERYGLSQVQLSRVLTLGMAEGWVERKGGYGWRFLEVAKTAESLEQIYRVRLVIEPAGLMEPTFAINRQVLESNSLTQRRLLDGAIETATPSFLIEAGVRLHEDIIRMSGNFFLHQTLVRINRVRRLLDLRSVAIDRKRLYRQCEEHLVLIDMIQRGENVDASHFLRRHLNEALGGKIAIHEMSPLKDGPRQPRPSPGKIAY